MTFRLIFFEIIFLSINFDRILSSSELNGIIGTNAQESWENSYLVIMCTAINYSLDSALAIRMIKDGVDRPIVAMKIEDFSDGNDTLRIPNSDCQIIHVFCWSSACPVDYSGCLTQETNTDFFWCGIATKCSYEWFYNNPAATYRIHFGWTLPFMHWGKYTCQFEQNGTIIESSREISGL